MVGLRAASWRVGLGDSNHPTKLLPRRGVLTMQCVLSALLCVWNLPALAGPAEDLVGPLRRLEGHTDLARCLAVSCDGRFLISGGHDRSLRLWDARSGKQLWQTAAHGDVVRSVAFSPDGKHVMSSGQDGLVSVWDAGTGKALRLP